MAELHKSVATLRILGDSLNPDEITRILGCPPTEGFLKGQIRPSKSKGIVQKTGSWRLEAVKKIPADLDAQVSELFGRMNKDLAVWTALSGKYEIDLFCGFFMNETDEGLELSTETLKTLGDRGVKLGFCIYAPIRDDDATV
jgi:hypothetical protein